jgi:hypothetical protein
MNMDEIVFLLNNEAPNPTDHPEILEIERCSTPCRFPDAIKGGLARLVLPNPICEGINAPPLALKVPRNGEKEGPKRYRDRGYKKHARFAARATTSRVSRYLPECWKHHREEQGC